MKRNIVALAFLLMASVSFAQNSNEARKILDKAYNVYENSKGIRLSFTITTEEPDGTIHPSQSGEAMIKGNKFRLEMDAIDTWFDGKTQWVFMKEANEVNISNPTNEEIASVSPLALLGMYKNGYTLKEPVSGTINGKKAYMIDLIPTGNTPEFNSISVAIDKGSNAFLQVILTMKNGMTNNINISNYNTNYNFSDSEFAFDKTKHPGVEIVDLR